MMAQEPVVQQEVDKRTPPPAIDWARVIAYAIVDADVTWTGRQILYVGEERLGAVPRLAICQNVFPGTEDVLTLFCDDEWNVLGCTGRPTVEENVEALERWYAGITPKLVYTGLTAEGVEAWLRKEYAEFACAFCKKLPPEVDNMISSGDENGEKAVFICYGCIDKLHAAIHRPADEASEQGDTLSGPAT